MILESGKWDFRSISNFLDSFLGKSNSATFGITLIVFSHLIFSNSNMIIPQVGTLSIGSPHT